jgi:hypothetical protein
MKDLERCPDGARGCISYTPLGRNLVHNANTLGGAFCPGLLYNHNESYSILPINPSNTAGSISGLRLPGGMVRKRTCIATTPYPAYVLD